MTIEAGEILVVETLDACNGMFQNKPADVYFSPPETERANPATGPIAIKGTKPGDVLAIHILDIELENFGFYSIRPDMGIITDGVQKSLARVVEIEEKKVHFTENIVYPVRPMVGVIGVAPREESIPTFFPGAHGGNMDNNLVRKGATVYLPVQVKGGLLAIGDVHASMGDGETTAGGIDISATVTVRVDVRGQNFALKRPFIETENLWVTTGYSREFYEATRMVVEDMAVFLKERLDITLHEALMLISGHGDVRICQAANCPVGITLRLEMPKL